MMSPAIKQSTQRKAYLNASIVAPAQGLNGRGGILVEDGWILAVGPKVTKESIATGTASFDCAGTTLIPSSRILCLWMRPRMIFVSSPNRDLPTVAR